MEINNENKSSEFDTWMKETSVEIAEKRANMRLLISKINMYLRKEKNVDIFYQVLPDGPSDDAVAFYHIINNQKIKVGIIGIFDEISVIIDLPIICDPVFKIIVESYFHRINSYIYMPPGSFEFGSNYNPDAVMFLFTHFLLNKGDEAEHFSSKLYESLRYIEAMYDYIADICKGVFLTRKRKITLCG